MSGNDDKQRIFERARELARSDEGVAAAAATIRERCGDVAALEAAKDTKKRPAAEAAAVKAQAIHSIEAMYDNFAGRTEAGKQLKADAQEAGATAAEVGYAFIKTYDTVLPPPPTPIREAVTTCAAEGKGR